MTEHRRSLEELAINPEMCHLVWVKMAGSIMSETAQDQRDQIAEWFLRSDFEEEDMDSVFDTGRREKSQWSGDNRFMVFGFKDPKKAIQFKLAWG